MRKIFFFILLLASLLTSFARAQNFETITAAQIYGTGGTPLASGTISYQPVDNNGNVTGYQVGGGGQQITWPTVCSIVNGTIVGACQLPNVSLTNPMNVCFAATVTNSSSQVIIPPTAGYQCVQPQTTNNWCSTGTCNYDQFIPNSINYITAKLGPPQTLSLGGVYAFTCASGTVVSGIAPTGYVSCVANGGGGGGGISGPPTSGLNNIVLWNNTVGTAVADAGFGFPLQPAHIGTLLAGVNGLANSATTDTTNASNITSGTLPHAQLPALVSSDIPNNAANTTGTSGGLSQNIAESQVNNLVGDLAARVLTSTTVNGNALSSNVTISASQITTGTLPHAQLPALVSGDIPNNAANTTGQAGTAVALAATPTLCPTGQAPTGVLASGNATGCAVLGAGGNVSNVGTPVSGQVGVWTGPTTLSGVTLLPSTAMPALTGDATNTAGALNMTVKGINGTLLSSLATGILKNTTSTGAISIAIASDFPTLNQNTTGQAGTALAFAAAPSQCPTGPQQFATGIQANGTPNCQTPAGSGNVSNVGTPVNGQLGVWNSATSLAGVTTLPTAAMPQLTGDVAGTAGALSLQVTGLLNKALPSLATGVLNYTGSAWALSAIAFSSLSGSAACSQLPALTGDATTTAGACATTVSKVNGVSVPSSAALLGTNSSAQLAALTVLPTSAEPAHTGDATNTAGSLVMSVVKVNGGSVPASKTIVGTNSSSQIVDATSATLSNNTTGTSGGVVSQTANASATGLVRMAHNDAITYQNAVSGGAQSNLATGATVGDATRVQLGDTQGTLEIGPKEIQNTLSLTSATAAQQYTTTNLNNACVPVSGQSAWCFAPSTGIFETSTLGAAFTPAGGGGGFTAGGDLSGSSTSQTVVGLRGNSIPAVNNTNNGVYVWNSSAWILQSLSNYTIQGNTFNVANSLVQTNGSNLIPAAVVPVLNQNTTGQAGTAVALAAAPTQCAGGISFATGVAANGNANCGNVSAGGTGGGAAPVVQTLNLPVGLSLIATSTVANTSSPTSLLVNFTGSNKIRSGQMLPTTSSMKTVRYRATGVLSTTGTPTLVVTPVLGGVSLPAITVPLTASLSGAAWELDYYFTVNGVTTVLAGGCFHFYGSSGAMLGACASGAATGLSFVTDQLMDLEITWGTPSASNTITANQLSIFPEQRI